MNVGSANLKKAIAASWYQSRRLQRQTRWAGYHRASESLTLQSKRLVRIGKEVDRLGGDEGATLEPDLPVEYERDELAEDIDYLARFPQAATARDLGITERGWRKIVKGIVTPLPSTVQGIRELAEDRRVAGTEPSGRERC